MGSTAKWKGQRRESVNLKRKIEITTSENQKENNLQKKKIYIYILIEAQRPLTRYIIFTSLGREEKDETKKVLEEIIAEIFQNLAKKNIQN